MRSMASHPTYYQRDEGKNGPEDADDEVCMSLNLTKLLRRGDGNSVVGVRELSIWSKGDVHDFERT
jgi:hypothetical protein